MFERFTADARNVVVEAQTIARQAGSRSIDTRHVLIALAELDGPAATALAAVGLNVAGLARRLRADIWLGDLDASALASLGIDLVAVRDRTDAVFGKGSLDRVPAHNRAGHIPFASEAKKALELALREAVRLHSSSIHSSFLLLGMLRCTGCSAEPELHRALADASSDPATLRAVLERGEARAS